MLTRLLERLNRYLPSAVQSCPPAALNDDQVDRALRLIRSIKGTLAALEVKLAGARAVRRGHGDGGASTLKELGGMSARQARQSVATAKTLGQMREVQGAIEDGHISADNAARLARAARKVSPKAVESDDGLLAAAQCYAADDFDRAVSRWEQAHQNDGGLGEHLANRRRRSLQFWTQHGMVHFKGRTDLISGTAIRRRLEQLAQQLRKQDAKTDPKPGNGTGPQPGQLTFVQAMVDALDTATGSNAVSANITDTVRVATSDTKSDRSLKSGTSPDPRLDSSASPRSGLGGQRSGGRVGDSDLSPGGFVDVGDSSSVIGASRRSGLGSQVSPGRSSRSSGLGGQRSGGGVGDSDLSPGGFVDVGDSSSVIGSSRRSGLGSQVSPGRSSRSSGLGGQRSGGGVGDSDLSPGGFGFVDVGDPSSVSGASRKSGLGGQRSANGCGLMSGFGDQSSVRGVGRRGDSGSGMPKAEIVVVMDLLALLGDNNARCEIPAVGPIPASIARRLAAVNGVVPILLDGDGEPLRHGGRKRLATREQWQALIARDGACIGCGADPLRCEAHHDPPFSQTRRTWIEELTLLCYECHHKVHDQRWQIVIENGQRTLQPPNTQTSSPPRNRTEPANHRKPVSAPTPHTHQPPMLC